MSNLVAVVFNDQTTASEMRAELAKMEKGKGKVFQTSLAKDEEDTLRDTLEQAQLVSIRVRYLNGVFASVCAHTGHITKEEAKEISGLTEHEFEKAYKKASQITENVMRAEGNGIWLIIYKAPTRISRRTRRV